MGNWKEVEVAERTIRINSIKWHKWESLIAEKKENDGVYASEIIRHCLNDKDLLHWDSLEYDPANAKLREQREEAIKACIEVNPIIFGNPKQVPPAPTGGDGK